MRLGFGLSQEQTQKLMMTPELRLAIKILQLSAIELTEYIEQELVENPVLEVVEETAEEAEEGGNNSATEEKTKDKSDEGPDIDWEKYFEDENGRDSGSPVKNDRESPRYDNFVAEVPTLNDHLMFQLSMSKLNRKERTVGEFFIGNIDDNGYLHCSADEAAIHCGVPFTTAEKVLKTIQGFDPLGVGAKDLRECLLIQYEHMGLGNDLLKKIIDRYLQEVAEGKMMKVAKKLGVSLQEMQEAIDSLKELEPKPGRKFSPNDRTRYIVPDVVVEKIDGEYIVLVNDVSMPRLTINSVYREMVRSSLPDHEGKKYLEAKLNSAAWLMKSIEQRRETLYKVARFPEGIFLPGDQTPEDNEPEAGR
jgi:RNA polymerase sigma-54 factor